MSAATDIVSLLFRHEADRPRHPAIAIENGAITYGEFCAKVRRLAAAFGEGRRVLIHLPQGGDAYAAMFAAAMAGAYYAPTNVHAPIAKQRMVLADFEPDVVVSTAALNAQLREGDASHLVDVENLPPAALEAPRAPHRLVYVMFTSGSTGRPKGVMIPRAALSHYVDWALRAMAVKPSDRWSQHPNIAFDLSVLDIYGALCGGATLVPLVSPKDRLMPGLAIKRRELTIWNSVPSVVELMIQAGQATRECLASLRLMTFCGEPLLPEHLDAIFAARPDITVHNTYGPTEATVSCTLLRLDASNYRDAMQATVAIGDPIDGTGLFLDEGKTEGEIMLAGEQLSDGYWRDPAATERAFQSSDVHGRRSRVYCTGDLGVRIGQHLYFKQRLDLQVKIRGYRLELDEVNSALRRCMPGAAANAAIVDGVLHTFVEAEPGAYDVEELRGKLAEFLEPHAIPARFHFVPRFPRNDNDKIDMRRLAEMIRTGQPD